MTNVDSMTRLERAAKRWADHVAPWAPKARARKVRETLEGLRRYGSTPRLEAKIAEAKQVEEGLNELL